MTKEEFVSELNGDLSMEYRSIIQYTQHIATVKGARFQQTLEELKEHVAQELSHALTLAQQIDFLGGVPTNSVADFESRTEAAEALNQDLELEERQLTRYRERVAQADELGLPDVAESLAPLLEETQEHVRDLRAVLDE